MSKRWRRNRLGAARLVAEITCSCGGKWVDVTGHGDSRYQYVCDRCPKTKAGERREL